MSKRQKNGRLYFIAVFKKKIKKISIKRDIERIRIKPPYQKMKEHKKANFLYLKDKLKKLF